MVRLPTWQCFRAGGNDSGGGGKGLSMVLKGCRVKEGKKSREQFLGFGLGGKVSYKKVWGDRVWVWRNGKGRPIMSICSQAMNGRICYIKSMLKESKHLGISKEVGTLRMEKAATTASSLEAEQDSGGYTPESDEGSKKLNELTELCIKLSEKGQTFGRSAQVYNKEEKGTKFEDYCWRSFSTAEEFLSTDEEIAQKLNEEEMTKARRSVAIRSLVKERFRFAESTEDMEKALWVELKRLFEPDKDDVLWKLQRYMHDSLTWRLYGSCAVH
ncbi:hypothetical protein Tco_1417609 [Tanacetum coccineum]